MEPFDIYPAIDLRNGRVVRLEYGDPDRQTVFGDDPVAIAQRWQDAGSRWLHVVNLDGAFDEAGVANWEILPQIVQVGTHVQFGGGVRSLDDVQQVLEVGVTRVILGTAAVERAEMVQEAVTKFGADRIVIGIDARYGRVKTRGWQKETAMTPFQLGAKMKNMGIKTAIYTDISRDGVLSGVNAQAAAQLARTTALQVIASGGAASLEDVMATKELAKDGVAGVIIGRALYDGRIDLRRALVAIGDENAG